MAYTTSLPMADPPAVRQGDAESGEDEYAVLCANCHGTDGRRHSVAQRSRSSSLERLVYRIVAEGSTGDRIRGATPGDGVAQPCRHSLRTFRTSGSTNVTAYVMTMRRLPRRPETEVAAVSLPAVTIDPASCRRRHRGDGAGRPVDLPRSGHLLHLPYARRSRRPACPRPHRRRLAQTSTAATMPSSESSTPEFPSRWSTPAR